MPSKRKVLIFTPGGGGGAEHMSVLYGKLLPKDRFYVKYIVLGRLRNIYSFFPDDANVDCIALRHIYAFSTFRILWRIIKEKPDIVFTSHVSYNSRVIIASKITGRIVITRSSGMIGTYPWRILFHIRLSFPLADRIIAQQEEMRDEIIRLLRVKPERVVTLHNPLDISSISKLCAEPSPYLENGCINFVNIARVQPAKAQDVAIKAFNSVLQVLPNSHLFIVGHYLETSSYFQELLKLIDHLGIMDNVHFIGFDSNPYRWIKYSDCFVFPSRNEGLPNSLIEASYLGVPCVATRCLKIIDEIILEGENGYVVEVDNVDGLAQCMIKAVTMGRCKMIYRPGTARDIVRVFDAV